MHGPCAGLVRVQDHWHIADVANATVWKDPSEEWTLDCFGLSSQPSAVLWITLPTEGHVERRRISLRECLVARAAQSVPSQTVQTACMRRRLPWAARSGQQYTPRPPWLSASQALCRT